MEGHERMKAGRPAAIGPGAAGLAAVLMAAAGAMLWVALLSGPWRLASGAVQAAARLRKTENRLTEGDIKKARLNVAYAEAAAADAVAGTSSPLLDVARLLPKIGDAVAELPPIVDAIGLSADAAVETVAIADEAIGGGLIAKDPDDPDGGSIVDLRKLDELASRVSEVRSTIARSAELLGMVDADALPRRIADDLDEALGRARDADARLSDAEDGFEILPGILGRDGPRTYLLGFQNNAEQRGTGGAILQFSTLEVDGGKISLGTGGGKAATTVYDIDRGRQQFDIPLPDDAWIVRQIPDAQRFGNSNWSPDWPLSATVMIDYAHAAEAANEDLDVPDFDGFMVVDPFALKEMMPGVGPFTTQSGNRITKSRVVPFVLYSAYGRYPIPSVRRAVLRQVVDRFFERAIDPRFPSELLEGAGASLTEKRIQIWMKDNSEQAFVKRMGWSGRIDKARGSDFMYVVEQNVGGNKLDYFATQETSMDVRVDPSDPRGVVVSTQHKVHNGVFTPQPRWILGDFGPSHKPMLSLYVPGGAELLGTQVIGERVDDPAPTVWTEGRPPENSEAGKKVWSATLVVPPGEDAAIRYEYRVPRVVKQAGAGRWRYRLVVQHQPKVNPETLTVRFTLPVGASRVEAPGWDRQGDRLVWTGTLKEDTTLEVSWAR